MADSRGRRIVAVATLAPMLACCASRQRSPAGRDGLRTPASEPVSRAVAEQRQAAPPDRVTGTIVNSGSFAPLPGRTVAIGGRATVSDATGAFVLDGVSPVYDVTVVEPGGRAATLYRGLRRRDPILLHQPLSRYPEPYRGARVKGTLIGGGPYPVDDASIFLAALGVDEHMYLARGVQGGPGFDFSFAWEAAETISGTLLAIRTNRAAFVDGGAPDGTAAPVLEKWFAQTPITIRSGETVAVSLTFARVSSARLSTLVNAPPGRGPAVGCVYRIPSMGARYIGSVGNCARRDRPRGTASEAWWDCEVAALPLSGARLCVAATQTTDSEVILSDMRCGISDGAVLPLTIQPAPSLTEPVHLSVWSQDLRFAWTPFDHGVYRLELTVGTPTPDNPRLAVYTAETSCLWPDLSAFGVGFPKGSAEYSVKIVGLGPYSNMDDAVGPAGIAAVAPWEMRSSSSAERRLIVLPDPGADAGPTCEFPYMTALVCDTSQWPNEVYYLAAINKHLRNYPQFAAAIGIHCVKDCTSARAYAKAYTEYSRQHRGFDANEPYDEPTSPASPARPSKPVTDTGR